MNEELSQMKSAPLKPAEGEGALEDALRIAERDLQREIKRNGELRRELTDAEARTERELEKLLLSIIDGQDAFDRILDDIHDNSGDLTPQMQSWYGNFQAVKALYDKILRDCGVTERYAGESRFDPVIHRLGALIHAPDQEDGRIVSALRPGYQFRERILRKTEVSVVTHRAPETTGHRGP